MINISRLSFLILIFILTTSLVLTKTLTGSLEISALAIHKKFYQNSVKKILNTRDNVKLPDFKKSNTIPKKIFQTHKSIDFIPKYYLDNLKKNNPGYEYIFHNNEEAREFLQEYYGEIFVNKFDSFKNGPHKADLWRLCVLYKFGGCYIDSDLEMKIPFDEIIDSNKNNLIIPVTVFPINFRRIFNALIICKPCDELIGECIKKIMLVEQKNLDYNYHFIIHLMTNILKGKIENNLEEKHIPNGFNLYLSNTDNFYIKFKKSNKIVAKSKRIDY